MGNAFARLAVVWLGLSAVTLPAAEPLKSEPLKLVGARPLPSLTAQFETTTGWTGGDVADSIPLGQGRVLWTFGDTFIGKIADGRRSDSVMINNTFAWQTLPTPGQVDVAAPPAPLQFFWKQTDGKPHAVIVPQEAGTYFWPAGGVLHAGRLYLFCKQIRPQAAGAPGLQFDWFANALLEISNPQSEPTAWKYTEATLPGGARAPRLGSACLVEGEYLYVYGMFPADQCHGLDRPAAVARIKLTDLPKYFAQRSDAQAVGKVSGSALAGVWEYWSRGKKAGGPPAWSTKSDTPQAIFGDGAPEMSVSRVRGIEGYVAVYTSLGLGADIIARHALRPEGPWSGPLTIYRCPDDAKRMLLYGAKAHPELATRDGQLVVTYCRNPGSIEDHFRQPRAYFPQGIEVEVKAGE